MARKTPKIVHLITRLELGGAQQNTLYCAEHHDRARFAVGLWAGAGGMLDDRARAIADADVRILPWLLHPIAPASDLNAVVRLTSMLRDVDLLHTHSSKAGILGRAAARLAGVRAVVHTVHGWSFNDRQAPQVRRLYVEAERAAARVTDRIVCVARHDVTRGIEQGIGHPSQYVVLRSGIDRSLYAAPEGARAGLRSAIGATEGSVVVGTIANFKPQKGPLDFIEAARLACARNPSLRFVFAGDGPMRPEVERAIDRAGLRGVVTLLGWRDDVPAVLAGMDIFLLSSLFEGLPRVVLQAMAASVPVVVTDTGGVTEVVQDGETGIVVPAGQPGRAAAAIVSLAADESARARFAGAARERLGDQYDIDRMVLSLESIYDELLDDRVRPKAPATLASHLGSAIPGH